MERVVRDLGASGMSILVNAALAVAIFGFGTPPWILIPVNLAGVTIYMEIESRSRRRSGHY